MIALTLLSISLAAQAPCTDARSDPQVIALVAALDRVAAVPPVWDDFKVANHPVLFLLDSTYRGAVTTPVCALVWRSGAALQVLELATRPGLSTPLYGFISLDPTGSRAQPNSEAVVAASRRIGVEDAGRLRAAGVSRAVALPVPLDFAQLGAFGEALRKSGADPILIQVDLAVHEGFHLQVQFPAWMDQPRTHAWPAWDLQPDRREFREKCYAGTSAVAAAFATEVGALLDAFDALYGDPSARDTVTARRHAQRFVTARIERHALLDTTTIKQGDGRIGCGLAEDIIELEEGTAQWIAHATLAGAGLRTLATWRGSYAAAQPDAFYRTGPLQLWVLRALVGTEEVWRLTSALARSVGPEAGVFAEFAARSAGRR